MQHAVAIVLTAVAVALLAFTAAVAHGLASEYGADVSGPLGWAVLAFVPACLALLCLLGARDPVGPPRPRTSVLAVGVLVVFAATTGAAVQRGASAHVRDRTVEGTACSRADLALLAALDAPGRHSEPVGDADGGCSMVVSWVPDVDRAVAEVTAALERDGWQRTAADGDAKSFGREDDVLRMSVTADGKATDVRLTVQPPKVPRASAAAAGCGGCDQWKGTVLWPTS